MAGSSAPSPSPDAAEQCGDMQRKLVPWSSLNKELRLEAITDAIRVSIHSCVACLNTIRLTVPSSETYE